MSTARRRAEDGIGAVSLHGVSKAFGARLVVRDLTLTVARGECVGLTGPNGSGKSTVLRLLGGLLRADSGEGSVLGCDLRTLNAFTRNQIGFLPQRAGLHLRLSVHENLRFRAAVAGLAQPADRACSAVAALGLHARRHEALQKFSGGWVRRIEIAATLLHSPRLLILDEPTTGIDDNARDAIWQHIHLQLSGGTAVVYSSHDPDELKHATRTLNLDAGEHA